MIDRTSERCHKCNAPHGPRFPSAIHTPDGCMAEEEYARTWSEELQCGLLAIEVNYPANTVRLWLPVNGCTDMRGAIRLATGVMPAVTLIETFSGALRDTVYCKLGNGKWQAGLADVPDDDTPARAAPSLPDALRVPEIAALVEALRPFARYMDGGMDCDHKGNPVPDEQGVGWIYLNHGQFRTARVALDGLEVGVQFTWDHAGKQADAITVTPPASPTC